MLSGFLNYSSESSGLIGGGGGKGGGHPGFSFSPCGLWQCFLPHEVKLIALTNKASINVILIFFM